MSVRDTIFNRMTHPDEDETSELLVNLMQKKIFRDACLRKILADNPVDVVNKLINNIRKSNIITQCSFGDKGRPDITIDSPDCFILIENKIHTYTTLQDNQINNYIEIIRQKGSIKTLKQLIFLIPKHYNYETRITKLKGNTNENKGIPVTILYWDDFLDYLYELQINTISTLYEDALEYLISVIDSPIVKNTTLNSMETAMLYSPTKIQEVYTLSQKIIDLGKTFVEKYLNQNEFEYSSSQQDVYGIGVYFKRIKTDNKSFFIGLSPSLSGDDDNKEKIDEKFSFSMCFGSESAIPKMPNTRCKVDDDGVKHPIHYIYMPLNRENLAEKDTDKQQELFNQNAKAVLDELCEIEDLILKNKK